MNNTLKYASLLGLIISASACHKQAEQPAADETNTNTVTLSSEQAKSIKTDTVKMVNELTDLTLTGKVSFNEDKIAKVYPLVGGNVIKVNVSLGDYVHKGEVLAIIRSGDIGDVQNQYNAAQSNLLIAKKEPGHCRRIIQDQRKL